MTRRRRPRLGEHENTERWLVSYADFITLLFAFFVVMYSLSSINEGKYRILSNSLVQAFNSASSNRLGEQALPPPITLPVPAIKRSAPPDKRAEVRQRAAQKMRDIAGDIRRVLGPLEGNGQVRVTEGAFGITVEINASVLFAPGGSELGTQANAALRAVGEVISSAEFPVMVEGHTDNTPINNLRFPSNWELSSARASSVVRLFTESGVSPNRLTAAGYADQRPIADNATEAGRARNRRVAIMLESRVPVPDIEPDTEQPAPPPADPGVIAPDDPISSILPPETGNGD